EIKNNGLYTPTERLVAVRDTFFPVPGQTLGIHKRSVESQASDLANAAYVENVTWTRSDVVFAALNITGSNNDLAPWGGTLPADAGNYPRRGAAVPGGHVGSGGTDAHRLRCPGQPD